MWKKMLQAIGLLAKDDPPAPEPEPEAQPAAEPERGGFGDREPPPSQAPTLPPPDPKPQPPVEKLVDPTPPPPAAQPKAQRVTWKLDDILAKVMEKPEVAQRFDRDDLDELKSRVDAALDPVKPAMTLKLAYVWAHNDTIPDDQDDLLVHAVWAGKKWRLHHEMYRVRELLKRIGTERAERILLDPRGDTEGLYRFYDGCPTAAIAVPYCILQSQSPQNLKSVVRTFEPEIRDQVAKALLAHDPPMLSARALVANVTDPTDPAWRPLWESAVSAPHNYVEAAFFEAFETLDEAERVALIVNAPGFEPEAAIRTPHPDVAARIVKEVVEGDAGRGNVVGKALFAQKDHAVPASAAALATKPPHRQVLLQALAAATSEDRVAPLFVGLVDSKKANREVAQRGLMTAPSGQVEAHVDALLRSKKKTERRAAIELLEARGDALASKLAQSHAGSEKDAALKSRLSTLAAAALSPSASLRKAMAGRQPTKEDGEMVRSSVPNVLLGPYDADPTDTLARVIVAMRLVKSVSFSNEPQVASIHITNAFDILLTRPDPEIRIALAVAAANTTTFALARELLTRAPKNHEFAELLLDAARHAERSMWGPLLEHLAAIGKDDLLEGCAILLENPEPHDRRVGVTYLERIGEAAIPLLVTELGAKKADARKAAISALVTIGTPEAREALEARLEVEKTKGVKDALVRGLRSFVSMPAAEAGQSDATLDAQLAALPTTSLPTWLDSSRITLAWADGTPTSAEARDWVLAAIVDAKSFTTPLCEMTARLDPVAGAAAYDVLRTLHDPEHHRSDNRWMIFAAAHLGNAAHRDALGRSVEERYRGNAASFGAAILEMLAAIADPTAIRWLDHWRRKARSAGLKENAGRHLNAAAQRAGLSVDVLLESAIPDLGFDAAGHRTFTSGARTFDLDLDAEGIQISLGGKTFKSLPSARKDEDAAAVKAAKAAFSALKKDVTLFRQLATDGFEHAMRSNRAWSADAWRAHVGRPLVRAVAAQIVFETGGTRFVLDGDATVRANGEPVVVEGPVTVAHPIDGALFDFEDRLEVQPFEQIDRPSFVRDQIDGLVQGRARIEGRNLLTILGKRGYLRGEVLDAGMVYSVVRDLGHASIVINHTGHHVQDSEPVSLEAVEIIGANWQNVGFDTLSEREISELGMDLASLP